MKILELFCGTKSFAKVAKERGHEVFTVDIDPQFKPDLCVDILEFNIEMLRGFKPDVIWASPPCTKFSIMTVYRNWKKEGDKYIPKNIEAIKAQNIVKKTIEIIENLKPSFFIIENPMGMLRKQLFMQKFKKDTVTYCQYGLEFQKKTDLFNNLINWKPKPVCSPRSPCHIRAPRGSKLGIQSGMKGYRENRPNQKHPDISRLNVKSASILRAIVPVELCREILIYIEEQSKLDKKFKL